MLRNTARGRRLVPRLARIIEPVVRPRRGHGHRLGFISQLRDFILIRRVGLVVRRLALGAVDEREGVGPQAPGAPPLRCTSEAEAREHDKAQPYNLRKKKKHYMEGHVSAPILGTPAWYVSGRLSSSSG